jgi:hypothetical protein
METGEAFPSQQFPEDAWFTAKLVESAVPGSPYQLHIHIRYPLADGNTLDIDTYVQPAEFRKMSREVEEELKRFNLMTWRCAETFTVRYFHNKKLIHESEIQARIHPSLLRKLFAKHIIDL